MNYKEKLKDIIHSNNTPFLDIKTFLKYFPELKESEDKRMKNFIANELACLIATDEKGSDRYKELTEAINWLEKQGEQKPAEKKELKKAEKEIEISFGAYDSELQEETYFIPKGFHAEINDDKVVIKKGEKPNVWSEEDEYLLDETIKHLESLIRITKKQGSVYSDEIQYYQRDIDWLKSLEDKIVSQPQWKPSDEQMYNLSEAAHYNCAFFDMEILKGLYDDLKKLREE